MEWNNIVNVDEVKIKESKPGSTPEHFQGGSSDFISEKMGVKNMWFDVRMISPGKMYIPYHFHTLNEEVFLILEGEATLRQDNQKRIVKKGELIFFETGPKGAHQLYNHSDKPVKYLDLVACKPGDVCEYPDSKKN